MKPRASILCCLLLAGILPANSQQPETPFGVHAWFARQYASTFLKDDAVGTSAYVIEPLDRLAHTTGLRREIFGYLPYWFRTRWNQLDYALLSTVAYFSGEVAADGSVGNTHGWPKYLGDPAASADVINFINAAHSNGVRVVLCFTNFDVTQIRSLVSNPEYRTRFVQQALEIVQGGKGDGININFEGIPSISRDSLTIFMQALADSFHTRAPGSQVSCAPTDFDTRQGDWDLPLLQGFVDLFFFQGYGYHYGGSTTSGPIGLLPNSSFWGSTNITTLISFVLSRISPDRVLLGLPHFGYRWPTTGSDAKSPTTGDGVAIYYPDALSTIATYGRQWDIAGLSPWYRYQAGTQWYQGWYDDPESMSFKYQFALDRNLMGVGMWALGQDGPNHDIWDVLAQYFSDSVAVLVPPRPPVLQFVGDSVSGSSHRLVVRWEHSTEGHLRGYRLYVSTSLAGLGLAPRLDESVLGAEDSLVVLNDVSADSLYFVRMVAIDTSGTKFSDSSDTYAVRLSGARRYLVVDGFDRVTGSWSYSRHAFATYFAGPLGLQGNAVDVADNQAVARGEVPLGSYDGVFWFLGDESVADRTFTPDEQLRVRAYLESGGRFFVTGSEVGYDLGRSGSPDYAPGFFEGFLKATYAGDNSGSTIFTGNPGSILEGVGGTCGIVYPEDYPDVLVPAGGSIACATYAGGQVAGVQYSGPLGAGTSEGRLVYLGFTFETIGDTAVRGAILQRVSSFFEGPASFADAGDPPAAFRLWQNFPNPFNPTTEIRYDIAGTRGQVSGTSEVRLVVYDLLGREVAGLVHEKKVQGSYAVTFNADGLASGVYLYRLTAGGFTQTRRLVVLR